jgi:hypothetical protein
MGSIVRFTGGAFNDKPGWLCSEQQPETSENGGKKEEKLTTKRGMSTHNL